MTAASGNGTKDVQMDRSDLRAARAHAGSRPPASMFSAADPSDTNTVSASCGLVLGNETVVAARQIAEVLPRLLQELEDRLGEVVPARDHALHVVLLVLHRSEEHGIRQVDHLRHTPAARTKEDALAFRRAVDDVFGGAEILADQRRFVFVERPLEVRRQEAVHDVHARRQAEFGDAPQDERLIGGLLGVLAEDDDPAGVERAVDVVVTAVDVQRVLGERARAHLQDHRRALARRVVILLDAVHDALARGVVDDALAADRVGDGTALGRVLALGLDGDRVAAEDVQFSFGERLLIEFAAFGRRRDRVKHAGVGDPSFGVIGNQLVSVGGDANPRVTRPRFHSTTSP